MRRVDWKSYCRDHAINIQNVRKGTWLEMKCPFCSDHSAHGALNQKSGGYNCWKCGKHSKNEFVAITSSTSSDNKDVFRVLQPYFIDAYIPVTREKKVEEEVSQKVEKTITLPGTRNVGPLVHHYLQSRGFNTKYMLSKYGLKDGGITGKWQYRLMIPVIMNGKVVAWQGRTMSKVNKLRYMASSPEESLMNIKEIVYNLDNCKRRKVIAVEGIFDCWKLGDDCVALFGISLMDKQIRLLAERFDEVYILFDPEKKAQEQAAALARKLTNLGCTAYVLCMQDTSSEDPGDLTKEEVKQIKELVFGDDENYDYNTPWLIDG